MIREVERLVSLCYRGYITEPEMMEELMWLAIEYNKEEEEL